MARLLAAALAVVTVAPVTGRAQAPDSAPGPEERTVVADERYARVGRLHRFLFGEDYRRLWATPFRVEVLGLATFAGGLVPVREVGQRQSRGLALRGSDGRSYTFRPLQKDGTRALGPDLRPTIAGRIAQDQIAALHPAATPVAAALLAAVGVPNAAPRLVALPDDERLGPFRGHFAGALGTIQEYPAAAADGVPGFAGATELVSGAEMLRRLRASAHDRVDAHAFLRARLMDLFLGDWDRHLGQWRFAKVPGQPRWQPIPEDRDFAFSRYEGLVLAVARNWRPRWVKFGEDYPDMLGLTWQAWPLDRLLLSELERPEWDELAADLQRRLSDEAIDEAVGRLPQGYDHVDGERLRRALRARRDALGEASARFYRFLAEEVRVAATDEADVAEAVALEGGDLEVTISRGDPSGRPGAAFFRRRFSHRHTDEVRLDLGGGDDRLVVRGSSRVRLRVLGGEGDDWLDGSAAGPTRFADWQGRNGVTGGRAGEIDRRPYLAPVPDPDRPWIPPRDWGRQRTWLPWFSVSPETGAFVGGGVRYERFAFRTHPFQARHTLLAGVATLPAAFKADYEGELRRENTRTFLGLAARASQLEILRFFGFGNETRFDAPERFHRVEQRQLSAAALVNVPLAQHLTASVGAGVAHARTDLDPGRLVGRERPYGSAPFGQLRATAALRLDSRDLEASPSRGVLVAIGGAVHPGVWDVEETFGAVHAEGATWLRAALPLEPTLALRAGFRHVFGEHPFHEATFVGGPETVRGFAAQRFAGDGGAWGGAELRLLLGSYFLVLPGEYGVFALADTGRVWLEGERSDRWHTAIGGGLWFAYVDRTNTVTVALARSDEQVGLYVRAGFLF